MRTRQACLVMVLLLLTALLAVIGGRKAGLQWPAIPRNDRLRSDFVRGENGRITYPGAVLGVDVSHHQGIIDWERVREDGVEFAILRIGFRGYTVGNIKPDESFARNYVEARQAGLKLGVYFYSQALSLDEARQEAAWVLQMLDGVELELPVFYDWEVSEEGRTAGKANSAVTDYALAFCQAISEGGYSTGVYFNQEYGYTIMKLERLKDYDFWIAEYQPYQSFRYHTAFWQFSCEGTVDGIDTAVDMDLMFAEEENHGETEKNHG